VGKGEGTEAVAREGKGLGGKRRGGRERKRTPKGWFIPMFEILKKYCGIECVDVSGRL